MKTTIIGICIFIIFPIATYKKTSLQNKQVGVLRMAFPAGKVLGTFEKRVPGHYLLYSTFWKDIPTLLCS